jgi:hypothetical protein
MCSLLNSRDSSRNAVRLGQIIMVQFDDNDFNQG